MAIAASIAEPPASRISTPARLARGLAAATIPFDLGTVCLTFAFIILADTISACTIEIRNIDRINEVICFINFAFFITRLT